MNLYLKVALATAAWCFFHSFFISHYWRDTVCRAFPRCAVYSRLVYVMASTLSVGALFWWLLTLPQTMVWAWSGWWQVVRAVGLIEAGLLFFLGSRTYDGRSFLGLRQITDHAQGQSIQPLALSSGGILGVMRHPWYTGTLIFLVFILPFTDVNLVWRGVFLIYTLIGTELEERKLVRDFGETYLDYRRRVPRFFPSLRTRPRD